MRTLVFLLAGFCLASANIHRGHKVVRVVPQHVPHVSFLQGLSEKDTGINLDFWTEPRAVGVPVDIQIGPEDVNAMGMEFNERKMPFTVMYDDLQDAINEHLRVNEIAKSHPDFFSRYHTYSEIMNWLSERVNDCGSNCEMTIIGQSYQGRDIPMIKFTNGDGSEKEKMWIDATIHAREWIAPAVCLYFIDQIIKGTDAEVADMLDAYDWYFAPMVNPDGYVYSHEENRMWRKTRKPNSNSSCVGTDANRNFDHNFGGIGTSSNPCSETYHGGSAYSQECARVISDEVTNLHNTGLGIKSFITMHSYSQLWMAPWGFSLEAPPNYNELMRVGSAAIEALREVHGTTYTLGSASEILYQSSGTSRDWAYGVPNIEYVFTIELRDTGNYGFLLPPEQILPSGEETWVALKAYFAALEEA